MVSEEVSHCASYWSNALSNWEENLVITQNSRKGVLNRSRLPDSIILFEQLLENLQNWHENQ